MQLQNQPRDRAFVRLLVQVVATACLLAGLAAVAGALFGALCGLAFWTRYGEFGIVLMMTTRCAWAGAGAGVLTGALGLLFGGRPRQGDLPFLAPQLVPSTHSRNGYCQVKSTRTWNGSAPQQEPLGGMGRPPLTR